MRVAAAGAGPAAGIPLGPVARRALLRPVQLQFLHRADRSAAGGDAPGERAPFVVVEGEQIVARGPAAGDEAQAVTDREELLGGECLRQRPAHVPQQLEGARERLVLRICDRPRVLRLGGQAEGGQQQRDASGLVCNPNHAGEFAAPGQHLGPVGQRGAAQHERVFLFFALAIVPVDRDARFDRRLRAVDDQLRQQPACVAGGHHQVAAAGHERAQLGVQLARHGQRSRRHQQAVLAQHPERRIGQQAVGHVPVRRRAQKAALVVVVAGVLVPRQQQRKHPVRQVVARLVGHSAPHLIDVRGVQVARRHPAGEEVQQQCRRRVHHTGLAVAGDELHRAALDLADRGERDGRRLRQPPALEADRYAVVEIMGIQQALQEVEAGSFLGTGHVSAVSFWRTVVFPPPAVEHRGVAEPVHAVLFAGAADEGVVELAVGQRLRGFGPQQNVVPFLQEIVSEGEGGERGHVVAQLVAELLKVALKAEVLREPRLRARALLLGGGPDVAPVLLAVVDAEKAVAERPLQVPYHARRGCDVGPRPLQGGAGNVAPQIEQVEAAAANLLQHLRQVTAVEQVDQRPHDASQPEFLRVALQVLAPGGLGQVAQGDELSGVFEGLPGRNPYVTALVVRIDARIQEVWKVGGHGAT